VSRLSWGRRSLERPRSRWRSILIAAAVVVGVCASVDGFVHRSIIDADTPAVIQGLLDQHLRTLEQRNLFHYERTLDRQNPAHTRCLQERYADGILRMSELRPNRLIQLEETGSDTTLVRAYVQRRDGIAVEYVRRAQVVNLLTLPPFDLRSVFFVWYLGSPTQAELGGQVITMAGVATLESWAIDQEAAETIKRELEALSLEFVSPPIEAPRATTPPGLRVRLLPAPEYGRTGCVNGVVWDPDRSEILAYPQWAGAGRSALSESSRAQLRDAYKEWDRVRNSP
jgi:hypothetical protein